MLVLLLKEEIVPDPQIKLTVLVNESYLSCGYMNLILRSRFIHFLILASGVGISIISKVYIVNS